ncbi:MAG: hypothetical protein Q7U66_04195 [Methylobacter sp.]|nr:hypothetical protein [Methylobacter sp.]
MTRQELAYHYKSELNQAVGINGSPAILAVLSNILNEAIAVLEPWINNVERPGLWHMEPGSRTIRIESATNAPWNLCDPDDAHQFNLCANLPDTIKPAAYLARLCTGAIKQGVIKPHSFTIDRIIDAYRCLDAAEMKNKTTKATAAKNANVERVKGVLEAYWKATISPTLKPAVAARILANKVILNPDDKMPSDAILRGYIRQWQGLPGATGK